MDANVDAHTTCKQSLKSIGRHGLKTNVSNLTEHIRHTCLFTKCTSLNKHFFLSIIKLLDEKEATTTESPDSKLLMAEDIMTTEAKKLEVSDTKTERDESTAAAGTKLSTGNMAKEQTGTTTEEKKTDKIKERKIGRVKGTTLMFIETS